jgi:RNA polymerase sigma-70 factor (ECF subfamily)
MTGSSAEAETGGPRVFATTHWSVVVAAGEAESAPAQSALETLCRAYWYPIYVYVRRKGHAPDDAQDLTQEFFAQVISKHQLRKADRNKGKFRTFLLAALDHFLAREWTRAHRQKRGGQFVFLSLDQERPEERYRLEPRDNTTPERNFERQWARTLLEHAMDALKQECDASRKGALFAEVRRLLSGEREEGAHGEISRRLGISETTVRVNIHRLRRRYGELLRAKLAETVSEKEEVEEELRYLMRTLSE